MPNADDMPSRDELMDTIARGSLSGHLGLFVGTGFSKAATDGAARTFEALLRALIDRLRLPIDIDTRPEYRLKSLPQIASRIMLDFRAGHVPAEQAGERFREEIAHLCNLPPVPRMRATLGGALTGLRPAWIITTNYDLVLEALLDDAVSVLPDEPLVPNPDHVPIYHLHGHRLNPSSIKITEEDYVSLLGPIDYQRLKLPLILLESTTLMLGYALGDINVRAGIEWSRSFRGSHGVRLAPGQGLVVQASGQLYFLIRDLKTPADIQSEEELKKVLLELILGHGECHVFEQTGREYYCASLVAWERGLGSPVAFRDPQS